MSEAGRLDVRRILEVLDRYRVDYVLVGGLAAAAHGATRATYDLDCCPDYTGDNLDRLAAAMVELDARLRVEGLGEDERLSFPIDRHSLARLEVSTWRTEVVNTIRAPRLGCHRWSRAAAEHSGVGKALPSCYERNAEAKNKAGTMRTCIGRWIPSAFAGPTSGE